MVRSTCRLGANVDEWYPGAGMIRVHFAKAPDGVVQCYRGVVGLPAAPDQVPVHVLADVGGGVVVNRPEGTDDVAAAAVVHGGGERHHLIDELDPADRGLARGKK